MFVELFRSGGLKSRRKSSGTALAQPQPLEACETKNAKRWGNFWDCPEDSYPIRPLPWSTTRSGLSPGTLPADPLKPPLWRYGRVTVRGVRSVSVAHKPCVSLQMGIDFRVENLSKKSSCHGGSGHTPKSNYHILFPSPPVVNP